MGLRDITVKLIFKNIEGDYYKHAFKKAISLAIFHPYHQIFPMFSYEKR
jgi:hypothetical protein